MSTRCACDRPKPRRASRCAGCRSARVTGRNHQAAMSGFASSVVARREASRRLTPEQERFALGFNPWDERDATYRVLTNQFITTRRAHRCAICFEGITVGQRVRSQTEVDDGRVKTFRFCTTCCDLMARRREDEAFERLMERYDLGRSTSEATGDQA